MKPFRRYSSTIHGNYRKAYLRCGLLLGALLALYIAVRQLLGVPADNPESYLTDGILLVAILLFGIMYRRSLPDQSVTLKEMMLFGIGTAVVGSVVYGLLLWAIGLAIPSQTILFTRTVAGQEVTAADPQLHYWAAWWALLTGVKMAVLGGLGAFLVAVFLKNEKSEVKSNK